jgi:predicted transposase YdaD
VPILKNGGNQQTVRRALVQLQQDEELVELESLLGFFASFVLNTELVQQIMRWDMTVLRESPWYQEIEQTGAFKEGQSLILRQLARRIGEVAPERRLQVQALSLTQLEALGEALLDFSEPADLDEWMRSQ